jgi:hypothetical protein
MHSSAGGSPSSLVWRSSGCASSTATFPVWGQTEKAAGEPKRPALQIGSALRFNEDWSTLKGLDLSQTDDFWDRLKFIPLTKDESVWLSFGGAGPWACGVLQ